jgi:riboflavin synthase
VNVERAAKQGAEVGGHELSGHVDFQARIESLRCPDNNHVLRIRVPPPWMRYVFPKGYIAVNGASLTVAEAGRAADGSGWFEVWLIPETLRITSFGAKREGDALNIEIERQTQVIVDTVRAAVDERLGPLLPALRAFARERGLPDGT